jgi:hypothetical protein
MQDLELLIKDITAAQVLMDIMVQAAEEQEQQEQAQAIHQLLARQAEVA